MKNLKQEKNSVNIRIIANYPKERVRNKNNEWVERGSLHVHVEKGNYDLRGIHYCLCKRKVWILMPSKKGIIGGKNCEFPVFDLCDKREKKEMMRAIQFGFLGFMKTFRYISWEEWEKREKIKRAKKKMVFVDLPSKKVI